MAILYKNSLVNSLVFRCFKICLSYENFHSEIVYLRDIFKCNTYLNDFVDLCIIFFNELYTKFMLSKKVIKRLRKNIY